MLRKQVLVVLGSERVDYCESQDSLSQPLRGYS